MCVCEEEEEKEMMNKKNKRKNWREWGDILFNCVLQCFVHGL